MNHKRIASFSQVEVMEPLVGHSAAATAGACHNFTIEWLSLMFEDDGAVSEAKARERMQKLSARAGNANPVLQKVFGERWAEGGSSYKEADDMMISIRGMKLGKQVFDYTAYRQEHLIACINKPPFPGFIYSFWFDGSVTGAERGAHTIGFFRSTMGKKGETVPKDGNLSAFDPNFGEYQLPAGEFAAWLARLKMSYGGFLYQMCKSVTAA